MKKLPCLISIAVIALAILLWPRPNPPVVTMAPQVLVVTQAVQKPPITLPAKRSTNANQPPSIKATVQTIRADPQTPKPVKIKAPITLEETPEHLRPLISNPSQGVIPAFIASLKPEDKDILVQWYQQTTNLLDKRALTWTLGFIGDEEVVDLFKQTLYQDYGGRKLTASGQIDGSDEEYVLFDTVKALGLLASTSDSAYELLKQGTDPWYWKDRVKWSSLRGRDTVGLLTAMCIQSIGTTGRPDSLDFLNELKNRDLKNRTGGDDPKARSWVGAVMDAAFYQDLIQKYGLQAYRDGMRGIPMNELWSEWKKSENGKKWHEWADAAKAKR